MNLPQFQLVVPAPHGAPFAGLAAQCKDEKILSIDYLPAGCFEKAKAEVADPQNQKVVGELRDQLDAYFKDPKSAKFEELTLCYSMLAVRGEKYCKVNLSSDERRKVLKKIRCAIPCGEVHTYGEVGKAVDWSNRDEVKKAVAEAYPGQNIKSYLAKAVGDICPANSFAIVVPCFRVVSYGPRLGELGCNPYVEYEVGQKQGWKIGREIKRWLLKHEGFEVIPPDESPDESDLSKWKVRRKSS